MGKIFTQLINRFDGGMTEDKRSKESNKYSLVRHFDAKTYPHKLVPEKDFEISYAIGNEATTKSFTIIKFIYALRSGTTYKLYGFGVVPGQSYCAVYYYTGTGWAEYSNNVSALGARDTNVFFYYKGFIYMWAAGTSLKRFDVSSVAVFNESYQAITYTTVAQPVHHFLDDIAYFFSDNKVHTLNQASWTSNVLTLPADLKIVDSTAYGLFLAIGCTSVKDCDKQAIVYLWDRDTSLTVSNERLDFGKGELLYTAVLGGVLFGIVYSHPKILIKAYVGGVVKTINELVSTADALTFIKDKFVVDEVLYFPLDLDGSLDSDIDARNGIWAIDASGGAYIALNVASATSYKAALRLGSNSGNIWHIAHNSDGSLKRSTTTYSTSIVSYYETLLQGEAKQNKKLVSIGVMTEPLPTAGQITIKYRLNGTGAYTTIFTESTNSSTYHEAINIESSGDELPQFREIQFMVESIGGAQVVGLVYKYEEIDDNPS